MRGVCRFTALVSVLISISGLNSWADSSSSKVVVEHPPLRVGAVLALTGPASIHGVAMQRGLEMAKEELSKKGVRVEIGYEDDQTQSQKSVAAFQSLAARGYKLFVGPTWDFQLIASQPVIKANNLIAISPTASSEVGGGSAPGVFFMIPPASRQLVPVGEFLRKRGLTRGFVMVPQSAWGDVHRKVFEGATKANNGTVLGTEVFDYGIPVGEFSTLLSRIRPKNPDVILITGGGADVANVVKARNRLGLQIPVVATDTAWEVIDGKLLAKDEIDDVFVSQIVRSPDFGERFKTRYGERMRSYADSAYDSLMLLAEAVSKTDGKNEQVGAYLRERADYNGVSGRKRFNAGGDVEDGEFEVVPLR